MRYTMIRTENLTKAIKGRPVVNGVTLEVEPGEIFGLLGMEGAGKTTLIRMLLNYVQPTEGRAYVLNLDTRKQGSEIRRLVGYLPENLNLFNMASGFGTLTGEKLLVVFANQRRMTSLEYARQLADRFGLDLTLPVHRLDEAGRQKLGLVQAFMHKPELLILDEPCQHLDHDARHVFYSLVAEVRADGRSVFMASDSIQDMERVCDRVAVLHKGELMAVERGVQLRGRALRRFEMRFANPVSVEAFAHLPNLLELRMDDYSMCCTVRGDPDALIKTASQFRVTDFASQRPGLDEVYKDIFEARREIY